MTAIPKITAIPKMTAILKTTAIPKTTTIPNMKKNPLGFAMTCQDEDPFSGVGSESVTVRIFI